MTYSGLARSDDEIVNWLKPITVDDVLVAIDAPLVVRNETGRRPCDDLISRCFGAYHASTHTANLSRPAFREGVRGEQLAHALDLDIDPTFEPQTAIRSAIEVYPHPAIVALFELPRILKYKAKSGRTLSDRSAAFAELVLHLESLTDANPPVDVCAAPRWAELKELVLHPTAAVRLDEAEDEIDAYVCAYVALYF
jgi:predicted RNase H-like nuclease